MNLEQLVERSCDMSSFQSIEAYLSFALGFTDFIQEGIQAEIVSRNENNYRFLQYREDGTYNVTRPINYDLMYSYEELEAKHKELPKILAAIKDEGVDTPENRELINRLVYTAQQSIGASLDALPANKSNFARKINGNLFERFIKLIISEAGVSVSEGTVNVPVEVDGKETFNMKYQHDLILHNELGENVAYGSVKTSSKDRLGKVFVDKLLYSKLTGKETPYFAIFLNDVQRKGTEGKYGVNTTFLSNHFKGYTFKLNPLDGVYYFDIRPNMISDELLSPYIKTFDNFIFNDVNKLVV
ncbi:hypothetical protein [Vibrio alginolyticus]|uniref:hypothetical protein n=1 Tax=Vibrio alginolyticus TaxID=663 RepID=UPI003AF6BC5C